MALRLRLFKGEVADRIRPASHGGCHLENWGIACGHSVLSLLCVIVVVAFKRPCIIAVDTVQTAAQTS